ncbi:MAG: SdiA-regulated domain-containing protein [Gemmatimonadaceae bacterium]|nr:SdiA-regulated domain-containing protein [Gemmatimonadaceae bacterium]
MKKASAILISVAAILSLDACSPLDADDSQKSELQAREKRLKQKLSVARQGGAAVPLAKWILPAALREVSGLALTDDSRLLAHNDEQSRVYVIDPHRGVALKMFVVGQPAIRADFEGITVGPGIIYMVDSNGSVYRFEEGEDREHVRYTLHDPKLGRECEFEGIAYEPDSARLLMPCKNVGIKDLKGNLVIYRWRPEKPEEAPTMMAIPFTTLLGPTGLKELHPSDITVDPATGNYVLITSPEKVIVEITPAGQLVQVIRLPGGLRQPEGIAITNDSILIVSDEARKTAASISLYRWPIGAAAGLTR